jgi:hypothetical protein
MLAPLGLEKGKPFKPAEREAKLLTDGAVIGELMSMNISFVKRFPDSYYRDDARWAYVLMVDPMQETGRETIRGIHSRASKMSTAIGEGTCILCDGERPLRVFLSHLPTAEFGQKRTFSHLGISDEMSLSAVAVFTTTRDWRDPSLGCIAVRQRSGHLDSIKCQLWTAGFAGLLRTAESLIETSGPRIEYFELFLPLPQSVHVGLEHRRKA